MKKIIFSLIIVMAVNSIAANPPANKCCTAGAGGENTGVCYEVYNGDGHIVGTECGDPGPGSSVQKNCVSCD